MKKYLDAVKKFFSEFDGGFEVLTITANIVFKDVTVCSFFYNGRDYPLFSFQYIPATLQIRIRALFGVVEAGRDVEKVD